VTRDQATQRAEEYAEEADRTAQNGFAEEAGHLAAVSAAFSLLATLLPPEVIRL
jgi:hypothetical protein